MNHKPDSPARPALADAAPGSLNPALAAEAGALTTAPPAPPPALPDRSGPVLDAHGFDPAEYEWLPVRRKLRRDGWTPQRQRDFIAALADYGTVERAACEVHMSVQSCYRLRRAPDGGNFAAAWDVALAHAARVLLDTAFERAFNGTDEPVFNREGNRVGRRMRQNDRLIMFLLRAYMPERFRHAHRDWRSPDEPLPPATGPMDEALLRLAPVDPDNPAALMEPQELADALQIADILPPGQLPHYRRGNGDLEETGLVPPPEIDAEITRMIHGDRNDPKFDHVLGPRVR